MDLNDFKPNSYKSKELGSAKTSKPKVERPKLEKVVKGEVKTKQKGEFRKLVDTFVSEDLPNLKNYVIKDVLIPNAKKIADEIFSTILWGESGRRKNVVDKVSFRDYNSISMSSEPVRHTSSTKFFEDFVYKTKRDAENVLNTMIDVIDDTGAVSVADLYELSGRITDNYMANNYGWANLSTAEVINVRGEWMLKLPKAMRIT